MGLKNSSTGGGEIVQVQGGHIIRATGRKDRHSKVFTAKGPRDRRVRLSAHTAIQFYDVQDRLGYDRPSKAVDWLIKKAKESIDKLAELPPWDPTASIAATTTTTIAVDPNVGSSEIPIGDHTGTSNYNLHCNTSNYADSMKSFFPTTNSDEDNNRPTSFQTYPHDLISRGSSQLNQDLCLSLHSNYNHNHDHHSTTHFLQGSVGSLGGFDTGPSGWAEQPNHQDMARFTRLMGWAGSWGGGFNPPGPSLTPHGLLLSPHVVGSTTATAAYSSQRGTLQSSYPQLIRALEDHHQHNNPLISSMGPGSDGFMGFYFPSQIHSELHGGANYSISNRASSSSLSPDPSQH